jgi:hypothetical protein
MQATGQVMANEVTSADGGGASCLHLRLSGPPPPSYRVPKRSRRMGRLVFCAVTQLGRGLGQLDCLAAQSRTLGARNVLI